MSTRAVFTRMVLYGLVLSVIDAVGGRALRVAPDPSVLLSLGATAWAAYRLAEGRQSRIAVPAALTLWLAYAAGFVAWARLLVGWNGSVPWLPPSALWVIGVAGAAVVIAVVAQVAGSRAADRSSTGTAGSAA